MKDIGIIVVVLILAVILYYAYTKLIAPQSTSTSAIAQNVIPVTTNTIATSGHVFSGGAPISNVTNQTNLNSSRIIIPLK